jgi:hypothetical protein
MTESTEYDKDVLNEDVFLQVMIFQAALVADLVKLIAMGTSFVSST